MERVTLFDINIHNVSLDEAIDEMTTLIRGGKFSYAVTPNVDHITKLKDDEAFRDIYDRADLVLADGVPLLWASRLVGRPLKGRVNGTDFFERACARAAEEGFSVYLLGGNPGDAYNACMRLQERHPKLRLSGWCCPPYGFESDSACNAEIQTSIREAEADILFVGLGAPKQEYWMTRYGAGTGARFAAGVGVSFSFVAGTIPRAPSWMQRSGLEWSWRLVQEPSRLWKRYVFGGARFISMLLGLFCRRLLSSGSI